MATVHSRDAVVMGTPVSVAVEAGSRPAALAAGEAALAALRHWDSVLTTWDSAGELARLNAAPPGAPVPVSAELGRSLAEAAGWVAATGGAFDPAVGALTAVWDLRGRGRIPSATELDRARARAGWTLVSVDSTAGRWTVHRRVGGLLLDAGGFGKGTGLRAAQAAALAAGAERVTLNLGGQVVLSAAGEVLVAHPARRRQPLARLRVEPGAVATTAQSERRVVVEGRVLGHVLDPRTGQPVPPWGSVTVVAADAVAADALSTALFVMGPDAALAWAASRPDIGVLVIELAGDHPRLRWSAPLAGRVTRLAPPFPIDSGAVRAPAASPR